MVMERASVATVLALLVGTSLAAQEEGAAPPTERQQQEDVQDMLVFEREVYRYPAYERRNPFATLLADTGGPRFEQLELRGVLHVPSDPSRSMAILGIKQTGNQRQSQQGNQQPTAPTLQAPTEEGEPTVAIVRQTVRNLRVGERWGNVRVLEIRSTSDGSPASILVEVTEFGITEQQVMEQVSRSEEGGR